MVEHKAALNLLAATQEILRCEPGENRPDIAQAKPSVARCPDVCRYKLEKAQMCRRRPSSVAKAHTHQRIDWRLAPRTPNEFVVRSCPHRK